MSATTGRLIAGRYNLVDPIGRGAMGVVWRARDSLLDRDVAIKEVFLSKTIGEDERENSYKRTMREARTAARLSHRGVVTVYDVAEDDGRPWIIMELVPSRSLEKVLTTDGPLPPKRACQVGQQLLAALAAAHAAGVLHRDVKPSNVLIANDAEPDGQRAVLTDFGIAQFATDPRLTQTGMVMGSPGFTAPERIQGAVATPASDLWSLGATLFAAVEGHGPYEERGGAITTMSAIIDEDPPPASTAGPLAPLIGMLMNRDPETRPTAAAAAGMFAGVLPRLPDLPSPAPRTPTVISVAAANSADASPAAASPLSRIPTAPGDSSPALPVESPVPPVESAVPLDAPPGGTAEDAVVPPAGSPADSPAPVAEASDGEPEDGTTGTVALVRNEPSPSLSESWAQPEPVPSESRTQPEPIKQQSWTQQARWAEQEPWTARQPWTGQEPRTQPRRRRRGQWAAVSVVAVAAVAVITAVVALQPWQSSASSTTTGTGTGGAVTAGDSGQPPAVQAIDDPQAVPANWQKVTIPPSKYGTTGGFSIGLPPGWTYRQIGLETYLNLPDNDGYLEIDLTAHDRANSVAQAQFVRDHALGEGNLPGYSQDKLQSAPIRGTAGAFWSYSWFFKIKGTMQVNDLMFQIAGQSYAAYLTSTKSYFRTEDLPQLDGVLRTFKPIRR